MPTSGSWRVDELEMVNNGQTRVVLSQTGIVMGTKIRAIINAGIEVDVSKVNVLILDSYAPMLAERVL
jgi:hypothetical protein